jgi:hypothetical protein
VKFLLSVILLMSLSIINGNDIDSTLYKWEPSLITSLNISQVAFTNWSKGGESSYSYVFNIDWGMKFKSEKWSFQNRFKGGLGHSKTGSEESNITANNMFNETVFKGDGFLFKPYISNIIRTPITNGFDYKQDPAVQIVAFFDPGYVTQSIGLAFEKSEIFQSRLGLAFEESFADKFASRYTDDTTTPDDVETFKFESGIESITDVKYEVAENVLYKGKLRLFSGFDRLDIWDIAFDNSFTAKVNSWLNVNLSYLVIYKSSESLKTQSQEMIQVGVVYSFF